MGALIGQRVFCQLKSAATEQGVLSIPIKIFKNVQVLTRHRMSIATDFKETADMNTIYLFQSV